MLFAMSLVIAAEAGQVGLLSRRKIGYTTDGSSSSPELLQEWLFSVVGCRRDRCSFDLLCLKPKWGWVTV